MPDISIIIPTRNAATTLDECLSAIYNSNHTRNFEVLIIDGESVDETINIASRFPCKILKPDIRGAGYARNYGAKNAGSSILFFIDADIVVSKETIQKVMDTFKTNPNVDAVVGLYSLEHRNKNFASQYKNAFVHYTYNQSPEKITWLFSAVSAVKKKVFDEIGGYRQYEAGEDIDLGQRISDIGAYIYLDKSLQVEHLKHYSLTSLVKNDFNRSSEWFSIFLKRLRKSVSEKRFGNASMSLGASILSVCLFPLLLIFFIVFPMLKMIYWIPLVTFVMSNYQFLRFIWLKKGPFFLVKSLVFTYLDHFVMALGMAYALLKRRTL